ncbi:MAG TPA: ATP-binding protein [Longimicrobium sp.]|nr:ATP-binding protein [Longimicrobium sp.]
MYVRRVTINHVRSISHLEWSVEPGKERGWHVIIGDNGAGKSSFLRSIALALVGDKDAEALRQDWDTWLSRGVANGSVELGLMAEPEWDATVRTPEQGGHVDADVGVRFVRTRGGVMLEGTAPIAGWALRSSTGWFSAAYGPFRRFSGGTESERIFSSRPRLAAHLSVFGEDIALTECIRWLQDLQLQKLENPSADEAHLIDGVVDFVNQPGFLPHHAQIHEISSKGVRFRDGNGYDIRVEDLSDGYRSVLSMAFELLRQLSLAFPPDRVFSSDEPGRVQAPGVVLIDEIDAHLHPTWQKRIGKWLREHFPNIQFIVTTHSPLICQAASEGSVWRLPRPGTNEVGGRVEGTDLERLVYGNVLDAYGTDLFGEDVSRSEESKQLLQRLAILNRKERRGTLTGEEREEQHHLRSILPTAADTLKTAEDLAA